MFMTHHFTAIVEQDKSWFVAYSPEVPGANGQGKTQQEAVASLKEAISLIFADRKADALRGLPSEAEQFELTLA